MGNVAFEYDCNKVAAFVMNPTEQPRIGYVVALDGFGLVGPLAKDLQVSIPFNTGKIAPAYKGLTFVTPQKPPLKVVKVVGVIERFAWEGGVGDPIKIDFYVSQENATQVKALQ